MLQPGLPPSFQAPRHPCLRRESPDSSRELNIQHRHRRNPSLRQAPYLRDTVLVVDSSLVAGSPVAGSPVVLAHNIPPEVDHHSLVVDILLADHSSYCPADSILRVLAIDQRWVGSHCHLGMQLRCSGRERRHSWRARCELVEEIARCHMLVEEAASPVPHIFGSTSWWLIDGNFLVLFR
ncbi:hypothetical protein B0O99DRAFT_87211 [Bisporella sp. PMI_857]|nr:hypothetical protein B0O99DRAFT_87211 [Bisporella sp. PMI_857]